jgi:hypothetical protein
MNKIDFFKLKSNYSVDSTSIHKCSMFFPNTCAIRMSEAIVKAEPKYLNIFKLAATNKCPHSYIRGAQDLASILSKPIALGTRKYGWEGNETGNPPHQMLLEKKE